MVRQLERAGDGAATDHRRLILGRRVRQLLEQRQARRAQHSVDGVAEWRERVEKVPRLLTAPVRRLRGKEGCGERGSPRLEVGLEEVRHLQLSVLCCSACCLTAVAEFAHRRLGLHANHMFMHSCHIHTHSCDCQASLWGAILDWMFCSFSGQRFLLFAGCT